MGLLNTGFDITIAAPIAYIIAAIVNYFLCIYLLFRHKARWSTLNEVVLFILVVGLVGIADMVVTKFFILFGIYASVSKLLASGIGLFFNFLGRRFWVFSEPASGSWKPQERK